MCGKKINKRKQRGESYFRGWYVYKTNQNTTKNKSRREERKDIERERIIRKRKVEEEEER